MPKKLLDDLRAHVQTAPLVPEPCRPTITDRSIKPDGEDARRTTRPAY